MQVLRINHLLRQRRAKNGVDDADDVAAAEPQEASNLLDRITAFRQKYANELDDEPFLAPREAYLGRERNPWD